MVGVRIALAGSVGDLGERVIELFSGDARQVGDPGETTIIALACQARGSGGELCDVASSFGEVWRVAEDLVG